MGTALTQQWNRLALPRHPKEHRLRMLTVVNLVVALGGAYAVTGTLVAIAFVLFQIERKDPGAHGAFAFRPLLLPGLILLWPLVILRWSARADTATTLPSLRRHKRVHAVIWSIMAACLLAMAVMAWSLRQHVIPVSPSIRIGVIAGAVA
jgi:hypothetical protein